MLLEFKSCRPKIFDSIFEPIRFLPFALECSAALSTLFLALNIHQATLQRIEPDHYNYLQSAMCFLMWISLERHRNNPRLHCFSLELELTSTIFRPPATAILAIVVASQLSQRPHFFNVQAAPLADSFKSLERR